MRTRRPGVIRADWDRMVVMVFFAASGVLSVFYPSPSVEAVDTMFVRVVWSMLLVVGGVSGFVGVVRRSSYWDLSATSMLIAALLIYGTSAVYTFGSRGATAGVAVGIFCAALIAMYRLAKYRIAVQAAADAVIGGHG